MRRPARDAPSSDLAAVLDRVLDKGIRVEMEISDVSAGSEARMTFSAAGIEVLRIEGTVSRSLLQNRAPAPESRRRGSRSSRRKSSRG
jgi:hypothetical protein